MLLSACSSTSSSIAYQAPASVKAGALIQSSEINTFLSTAPANASLAVTGEHWGEALDMIVQDTYFAASGRACREAQLISLGGGTSQTLFCEAQPGLWSEVRPVIRLLGSR